MIIGPSHKMLDQSLTALPNLELLGSLDWESVAALETASHSVRQGLLDSEGRVPMSWADLCSVAPLARLSPAMLVSVKLNLRGSSLGAAKVGAVAAALPRTLEILDLDLSRNRSPLAAHGVQNLVEALPPSLSTVTLDLRYNQLGTAGARFVASALPKELRSLDLDLSFNRIGLEGARAVVDALPCGLQTLALKLESNSIGDQGGIAVGQALMKLHLLERLELDLTCNRLQSSAAEALAEAVRHLLLRAPMQHLKLRLLGNALGFAGSKAIREVVSENQNLTGSQARQVFI